MFILPYKGNVLFAFSEGSYSILNPCQLLQNNQEICLFGCLSWSLWGYKPITTRCLSGLSFWALESQMPWPTRIYYIQISIYFSIFLLRLLKCVPDVVSMVLNIYDHEVGNKKRERKITVLGARILSLLYVLQHCKALREIKYAALLKNKYQIITSLCLYVRSHMALAL